MLTKMTKDKKKRKLKHKLVNSHRGHGPMWPDVVMSHREKGCGFADNLYRCDCDNIAANQKYGGLGPALGLSVLISLLFR